MTDDPTTTRFYLKHLAEPHVFAVEADEAGTILYALDLSDEYSKGEGAGLCSHMLDTLPLQGHVEDIERLNIDRSEWKRYAPDCTDIHHMVNDLMTFEQEYLADLDTYNDAAEATKRLKKRADASGERVHTVLQRMAKSREPLPLFDEIDQR